MSVPAKTVHHLVSKDFVGVTVKQILPIYETGSDICLVGSKTTTVIANSFELVVTYFLSAIIEQCRHAGSDLTTERSSTDRSTK